MYPTYHTASNGPILIYPSSISINPANIELFGDSVTCYVTVSMEYGVVGKYLPGVPGYTIGLQLAPFFGIHYCDLVFKFTVLFYDVDHLVDYVSIFGVEVSWSY